MTNTYHEGEERAKAQAGAQLASIEELVTCLEHAEACDNTTCGADCPHDEDEAREAIREDALSVEVRTDWHTVGAVEAAKPTHYRILLATGGPAVQLVGTLDDGNQPDSAILQYQNWCTPWMAYRLTDAEEQTLLTYAQQFYFEG